MVRIQIFNRKLIIILYRFDTSKLRIAFVCYRDYGCKNITETLDFTNEVGLFKTKIGKIVAGGGGD